MKEQTSPRIVRRETPPKMTGRDGYRKAATHLRRDFDYRCAYCLVHEQQLGGAQACCIVRGGTDIKHGGVLRLNQWGHIAAVSGKDGMKLYFNGVLMEKNDYPGSFSSVGNNEHNYFGKSYDPVEDEYFHGQMDEIRIWKVARTQQQIRENMFKRLTGNEKNLIGLWDFDSGDARDASKSDFDGKLMGDAHCVETELPKPSELNVPAVISGTITDTAGNPLALTDVHLERGGEEIIQHQQKLPVIISLS